MLLPTENLLLGESAYSGEAGVRLAYSRIETSLNYAVTYLKNPLALTTVSVGGSGCYPTMDGRCVEQLLGRRNEDSALLHSVEASFRLNLFSDLHILGALNYTYGDVKLAGKNDATEPMWRVPPLMGLGLLVAVGGAVVGGARIALSRGLKPERFVQEIRQYGVTVVSYTWAMLGEVVDDPEFVLRGHHPVRLFIGSGMPTGLWQRLTETFAPARVVEFFATTDGQAVLANVSGAKVGSKGRPLPGGGEIELAAYDADFDLILEDDRGFVQVAAADQIGVLAQFAHLQ